MLLDVDLNMITIRMIRYELLLFVGKGKKWAACGICMVGVNLRMDFFR